MSTKNIENKGKQATKSGQVECLLVALRAEKKRAEDKVRQYERDEKYAKDQKEYWQRQVDALLVTVIRLTRHGFQVEWE